MDLPLIKDYEILELIGEGSCGFVYRCRYKKSEYRAIKLLKGLAINRGLVDSEVSTVAASPRHENLTPIHGYHFEKNPCFVISDLYGSMGAGGDAWSNETLEGQIGIVPIDVALRLIAQMASALDHLHRLEVFHGGFKPSNVFVEKDEEDGMSVRICDWGQGYMGGLHYMELGDCGFYASPEQLETGDFSQGRGKSWDVYAFGVVAYRLLTGRLPRLESQFHDYFNQRKGRQESGSVSATVLEQPGQYVEWLRAQADVRWPSEAKSEREGDLREVIERCLSLDPLARFADMREVAVEILAREREASVRQMERRYASTEVASSKTIRRWKAVASLLFVGMVIVSVGAFLFLGKWKHYASELNVERQDRAEWSQEQQAEFRAAFEQQQGALVEASEMATANDAAARKAREILQDAQANGDRLFELLLERPDSDMPGYRAERRRHLREAQQYYEGLVEVYANHPDFMRQSAHGYRFLGEIYREIGSSAEAAKAFQRASSRFEALLVKHPKETAFLEQLAKVTYTEALVQLELNASLADVVAAALRSTELWKRLAANEKGAEASARLMLARLGLIQAEANRRAGLREDALEALAAVSELLTPLVETGEPRYAVLGLLGRTWSEMGVMLSGTVVDEEAAALFEKAKDLLAEAISLNGAILEDQFQYAACLARLGREERDSKQIADAILLLRRVLSEDQSHVSALVEWAACEGVLAEMERDGGKVKEAVAREKRLLEELAGVEAAANPAAGAALTLARGKRLCHLAALMGDENQFADSLTYLQQAIETMRAHEDNAAVAGELKVLLAEAEGLAGFAREKGGKSDAARAHYESSLRRWKLLLEGEPENERAQEGLDWATRQLEGLK